MFAGTRSYIIVIYKDISRVTQQAGKSVDHIARWPTTACLYSGDDDDCVRSYNSMFVERGRRSGGLESRYRL